MQVKCASKSAKVIAPLASKFLPNFYRFRVFKNNCTFDIGTGCREIIANLVKVNTGCSLNIVFFPRILKSLSPFPRQHSASIGCTNKLPANRSDCKLALR